MVSTREVWKPYQTSSSTSSEILKSVRSTSSGTVFGVCYISIYQWISRVTEENDSEEGDMPILERT